jgi:glycosyltransferase involved in cell wall biosynthesis
MSHTKSKDERKLIGMISFVWSSKYPFIAGSGGSETYTAGHIRELTRLGIPARIITIGHGTNDGREDFPDIEFLALDNKEELSELDDLLVYITYPLQVKTSHQPYAILHCPPPNFSHGDPLYVRKAFKGIKLIAASRFAAGMWRRYLRTAAGRISIVYPFAHDAFSAIKRPKTPKRDYTRILFAGRLSPDKGIYTLLAALHMETLAGEKFKVTVTTAGSNAEEGKIILRLVKAHPQIRVVRARKNSQEMAKLIANHDIVVMPSSNIFWQELFGMLSIEAQHAGTRVVASRSGGLPETNLGGATFVQPDNPKSLAAGMAKAIQLGPLTAAERRAAVKDFTVTNSVDSLLKSINYKGYLKKLEQAEERDQPTQRRRIRLSHGAEALPHMLRRRLPGQVSMGSVRPSMARVSRQLAVPAQRELRK